MSSERQIIRSAGVVGASTLLSRILGLIRDMVMTHFYGTGLVAEAFYVAFMFPALLRRLVGEGSLTVSFISVFTKFRQEHGEEEAQRLLGSFWMVMVVALAALTILGMFFSRELVALFTHEKFQDNELQFELAVVMTAEMFPYLFLIGLVALYMGVLNSYKHFFAPAFHPVLLNLAWISAVFVLQKKFEQPGLSAVIGVLVGGLLQLALQIPFLWKVGARYRPRFNFKHPAVIRIGQLMIPTAFAVGIVQINTLIATYFVTQYEGGRSQLFYASRLSEFPYAIFTLALATAVLPTLSEMAGKRNRKGVAQTLLMGLRLGAFVIIPASIGLIFISQPLIHLIFEHGEFTADDTKMTAYMLVMFCLGLWAVAGLRLVVQAYYAVEDMVTPLRAAAFGLVANVLGCLYFSWRIGAAGVPLAITVAAVVNLIVLGFNLSVQVDKIDFVELQRTSFLSVMASVPMIAIALYVRSLPLWEEPGLLGEKIAILSGVVLGGALLYGVGAWILGMEELKMLTDSFIGRIGKRK